jgi:3-phosphoshikimate 1-carboxyvinyltransferase
MGESPPMRIEGVENGVLRGRVRLPGDKSISHRALILGAIAQGVSQVRNFLSGNDCVATLECLRALGVDIQHSGDSLLIQGVGSRGLGKPKAGLDCRRSATTMRLLAGVLAGQPFASTLDGSPGLRRRPMGRIIEPLRRMGCSVVSENGGLPPFAIRGGRLQAIDYQPPVASAQVKSAVLLAGLYAEGRTVLRELVPTRDHTERLLNLMGAHVETSEGAIGISPGLLRAIEYSIPGDMSSAAFFLVAACLVPGSEVRLSSVGVNPTRTGLLDTMKRMGAEIVVRSLGQEGGEPVADLVVRSVALRAVEVGGNVIPRIIDELPILAVAATQAEGVTIVKDAAELRVKETDRIATVVGELRKMGAQVEERPDGFIVEGPTRLHGARLDSHGDHRVAMSLSVAALLAEGESFIAGGDCTGDSYPWFEETLKTLLVPASSTQ